VSIYDQPLLIGIRFKLPEYKDARLELGGADSIFFKKTAHTSNKKKSFCLILGLLTLLSGTFFN